MPDVRRPRTKKAAPSPDPSTSAAEDLRGRAEERLAELPAALPVPGDLAAVVHELRVHQVELELQNEELRRAGLELDAQRAKYFDLFDLAPVGYLTLSDKSIIHDANLTAALLLGGERRHLVGRPLSSFVLAADQTDYYLHRALLARTGEPQSCELRLRRRDAEPFWALLEWQPQVAVDGELLSSRVTLTDISARKRIEATLHESEAKYRQVVERASDGIAILQGGVVVLANEALAGMSGYSVDELTGMRFLAGAQEGQQEIAERVRRRLAGEQLRTDYEIDLLRRDGSPFTAAVSAGVITFDGAAADLVLLRDVSEHRRQEEALRRSEAEFRRIVETAVEGIIVLDSHARMTLVNQQMADRLGYTIEEMVGLPFASFLVDEEMADHNAQMVIRARGEGAVYERCFRRKDGGESWALISARALVDAEGKLEGSFATLTDITARKQAEDALRESEERYRSLFEDNHAVMLLLDPESGAIVDANPAASAWYGWSRAEMLAMRIDQISTLSAEDVRAEMETAQAKRRRVFSFRHRRADGTIRDVEVYSGPIALKGRTLIYSLVHDITERRQVEAELLESEERFQRVFDSTRDLVSILRPVRDEDGAIVDQVVEWANATWRSWFGWADLDPRGHRLLEIAPWLAGMLPVYARVIATGESDRADLQVPDGRWLDADFIAFGDGLLVVSRDVTERKHAEEALRESEARYRAVADSATDAIITARDSGEIAAWNAGAERMFGYAEAEAVGRPVSLIVPGRHLDAHGVGVERFLDRGEPRVIGSVVELEGRRRDGTDFPIELSLAEWTVADQRFVTSIIRDVATRKAAEEELLRLNDELAAKAAVLEVANATITHLAATDDLTGLANRRRFHESLERAVSLARRHGSPLAVVSFDLDGLKRVNDSAGHEAGDEVLASFAALLATLCRLEDLPARLGGDEFSVLLPGIDLVGARGFAERVLVAVRSHAALQQHGVTASGGVAQWGPSELPDDLLRRADDALYAAKRDGGDAVTGGG